MGNWYKKTQYMCANERCTVPKEVDKLECNVSSHVFVTNLNIERWWIRSSLKDPNDNLEQS